MLEAEDGDETIDRLFALVRGDLLAPDGINLNPVQIGTVTSVDGPDAQLRLQYTFGCDPEVFVGTWD